MTTQEPVETLTEWGVRWDDGYVQARLDEATARNLVQLYRAGAVICRTVTRTEWREVRDA